MNRMLSFLILAALPVSAVPEAGLYSMRIRRRLPTLLGVLLVIAAVAIVVVLRKHAPPEAARLLPGADGFLYVNLKRVRRANVSGKLPEVSHDPDYEQFIRETGFEFERDLDQMAVAIHYLSGLPGNKNGHLEARYSEIFVGKIDGQRLRAYLQKLSLSVEKYGATDIFSVPFQGRTDRVAFLSVDTVAVSNHPDPQVIRGMIDRSRKLASPFGGPAFLRQYYRHLPIANRYVPFAGLGWAVVRVGPSSQGLMQDLSFLFPRPAVVVASAHYIDAIQFKAEAFTDSEDDAREITDKVGTFLSLFHSAEANIHGKGSDADVKQFFDSLHVQQDDERAVLTATVSPGFIQKALAGPPENANANDTTIPGHAPAPATPVPITPRRQVQ